MEKNEIYWSRGMNGSLRWCENYLLRIYIGETEREKAAKSEETGEVWVEQRRYQRFTKVTVQGKCRRIVMLCHGTHLK